MNVQSEYIYEGDRERKKYQNMNNCFEKFYIYFQQTFSVVNDMNNHG